MDPSSWRESAVAAVSKFKVALPVNVAVAAAAQGKGDAAGESVRTPAMMVVWCRKANSFKNATK